jgi:hypothetical protein
VLPPARTIGGTDEPERVRIQFEHVVQGEADAVVDDGDNDAAGAVSGGDDDALARACFSTLNSASRTAATSTREALGAAGIDVVSG